MTCQCMDSILYELATGFANLVFRNKTKYMPL